MDKRFQASDIIFYNTPDGDVKIEVIFNDETFWLTQKRMAELFGVESNTITYHLKEIYKTGELEETATTRKIRVVQKEGNRDVTRDLDFLPPHSHQNPEKFVANVSRGTRTLCVLHSQAVTINF